MAKDPETRIKELFYAISLPSKRYHQCLEKMKQYRNTIETISSQLPEDQQEQLRAAVDHLQTLETCISGYELGRALKTVFLKAFNQVFPIGGGPLTMGQIERVYRQFTARYETFIKEYARGDSSK